MAADKKRDFPGVWCCEKRVACRWQGYALHQGLGWGTVRPSHDPWRIAHDRECGGKLIQLLPRGNTALSLSAVYQTISLLRKFMKDDDLHVVEPCPERGQCQCDLCTEARNLLGELGYGQ